MQYSNGFRKNLTNLKYYIRRKYGYPNQKKGLLIDIYA